MKFLAKKNDLLKALKLVQISLPNYSSHMLFNVLIETTGNKLILIRTNMEMSIKHNINVKVVEEGSIVLPAKKLTDIIKKLPENDVEVKKDKDMKVVIKSGETIFHLFVPKKEFPTFPDVDLSSSFSFNSELREMFRKTAFASAVNDIRCILNGVYWVVDSDGCKMVATNKHRLAFIKKQLRIDIPPINVIVPAKMIYEINRVIKENENTQMVITQDKMVVFNNKKVLVSKLIEGEFLDYKWVISEKQDNIFVVNTEELLSACRRVSLMAKSNTCAINFFVSKERLKLTANIPSLGEAQEDVEVVYNGQDVKIILNHRYITDVLKNIDTEEVSISFQTADEVVAIRPVRKEVISEEYIYVVMPMENDLKSE